jgi:hypothetical protein
MTGVKKCLLFVSTGIFAVICRTLLAEINNTASASRMSHLPQFAGFAVGYFYQQVHGQL